jgi:hypothetical protein
MSAGTIVRIVLLVIGAVVVFNLVMWLLGVAFSLLRAAIVLAVVVGIIWLLVQIFSKKRNTLY